MIKTSLYRSLAIGTFLITLSACGGSAGESQQQASAMDNQADQFNMEPVKTVQTPGMDGRSAVQDSENQTCYFDFDRSAVKDEFKQMIHAESEYLLAHPQARVRIEGHTDDVGSREYNIALGWRRAKAVARLIEEMGVPHKQLALVSYGKERPAVVGIDPDSRAQNRRAELIYEAR